MLSATPTAAGSSAITLTVPTGQRSVQFYVQGFSSSGSGTYTASSTGITSATGTATLAPSGIAILPASITGSLAQGTVTASVSPAILDGTNTPLAAKAWQAAQRWLSRCRAATPACYSSAKRNDSTRARQRAFDDFSYRHWKHQHFRKQPAGFTMPNSNTSTSLSVNP